LELVEDKLYSPRGENSPRGAEFDTCVIVEGLRTLKADSVLDDP